MRTVLDVVALVVAGGVVVFIAVTVGLVVRDRPRRPSGTSRDPYRVRGRSVASWRRSAIREIRRAGRAHGGRGRRRR